jgi:hypothetical protein
MKAIGRESLSYDEIVSERSERTARRASASYTRPAQASDGVWGRVAPTMWS